MADLSQFQNKRKVHPDFGIMNEGEWPHYSPKRSHDFFKWKATTAEGRRWADDDKHAYFQYERNMTELRRKGFSE